LKAATHCKVIGSKSDSARIPAINITLQNNDTFKLGNSAIKVIECSGHTLGYIAFYLADANALFCVDTLFSMGCGRLFEGSAEQMWQSLTKFTQLPLDTQIYCAHEYSLANAKFALSIEANNAKLTQTIEHMTQLREDNTPTVPTSLKQELATNPFLRVNSVEIRSSLHLNSATE
jgi:hydroxyacylglutathione hydrolase